MSDLPISPSDLPWWGWLLCAAAAGIATSWSVAIESEMAESTEKGSGGCGCVLLIIAFVAAPVGVLSAVIGVIRFVKWVWGG